MSLRRHLAAPLAARVLILLALLSTLTGCQAAPPREPSFAEQIAAAHGIDDWDAEQALQGEFLARFDDGGVIDLRFVFEIDGPRVRVSVGDGTPEAKPAILLYDGQNLTVSAGKPAPQDPRTIVQMWPTLITLPFRLTAATLEIEPMGTRQFGGTSYDVAKVTFAEPVQGLGDWLLMYTDPESRLVKAVVYAIGNDPRAISFYNFEDVSGVRLSTEWKFWRWSEGEGIYDKPVATGRLFNLGFTTVGALRSPGPSEVK